MSLLPKSLLETPDDDEIIEKLIEVFPRWIGEAKYLLLSQEVVSDLKSIVTDSAERIEEVFNELGHISMIIGGNSAPFAQIILDLISEHVNSDLLKQKIRDLIILDTDQNKQLYSAVVPVEGQSETERYIFFEEIVKTGTKLSQMLRSNLNIFFIAFASSILFTKDSFTVEDTAQIAKALKLKTVKPPEEITVLTEEQRDRADIMFKSEDYPDAFHLIFLMSLIAGVHFGVTGSKRHFFSQKADRYVRLDPEQINALSDKLGEAKNLFTLFKEKLSKNSR